MDKRELATKLAIDPRYFIETFFNIIDKDRKEVPFIFNQPQSKYYEKHGQIYKEENGFAVLSQPIFDLILKARKQGFSSGIEAIWLHACLFVKNARCVVMSHEKEATKRHLEKVRYYLKTMGGPGHRFTVELEDDNQMQLSFPQTGASYWIGTAGAKAFGRGDDITHLHLSEVSHYEHQETLTGVLEACVPNAWRVMETTGNGIELFHRLWKESSLPNSQTPWKPFFCAWFEDASYEDIQRHEDLPFSKDERDMQKQYNLSDRKIYWYRHKKASMVDPALMPQEYPSNAREAFLTGGLSVFDAEGLKVQETKTEEPEWRGVLVDKGGYADVELDPTGQVYIWRRPDPKSKYLIWADVAYGKTRGDYSAAGVFRYGTRELVALWYGKIDPTAFGQQLYGLGMYYNWAKVAVEVFPGPGIATVGKMIDLNYPGDKMYRRMKWDGEKHVEVEEVGWVTDERTRPDMISAGQVAIRVKNTVLRSRIVMDQLYNFIRHESGKIEARHGTHDDCAIMFCGAMRVFDFDPVGESPEDRPMPYVQITGGLRPPKKPGFLRSKQFEGSRL